jgi:SAM-dependent methyltransferase
MNTEAAFWHTRFRQQVGWTAALRRHIFREIQLSPDDSLLEVGCGSGALLHVLQDNGYAQLAGLDKDLSRLEFMNKSFSPVCGDGLKLPFPAHSFKVSLCHFYLLWVTNPMKALLEMKRVTRPGGWLVALAEPDYGQRIDKPDSLVPLGKLQTQALTRQGADPFIGARLPALFSQIGLAHIQSGVLTPQEPQSIIPADFELEWRVIQSDLAGLISEEELARYKRLDQQAWQAGTRVLHVPVHFAYGQVV